MSFIGASVEELRRLSGTMTASADRITNDVVTPISRLMDANLWLGQDSSRFLEDWQSALAPRLKTIAGELDRLAGVLLKQADEQEVASSDPGARASGPAGGVGAAAGSSGTEGLPAYVSDGSELLRQAGLSADTVAKLSESGFDFIDAAALAKANPSALAALGVSASELDKLKATGPLSAVTGGAELLSGIYLIAADGQDPQGYLTAAKGLVDGGGSMLSGPAGDFLGKAGGVLGVAGDMNQVRLAAESGDVAGAIYSSVHAGVSAVGVVVPPVAWCVTAADTGVAIGQMIGNSEWGQATQAEAVDIGLQRVGGDPSKLVERYEGVPGFFNAMNDWASGWFN